MHPLSKKFIENSEPAEETVTLIADGAYSGEDIRKNAIAKNMEVLTTGLSGKNPRKIVSEFNLSEDGKSVISCPEGNAPKSSSYISQTNSIRISFFREHCENCPRREECNPKLKKRTALLFIPVTSWQRSRDKMESDPKFRQLIGRIRNGIETVPSVIRNKYRVDRMPVRGKLRTSQFFGFKIGALNFSKLLRFLDGKARCRAFQPA